MFSKIKSLAKFKKGSEKIIELPNIQEQLSDGLFKVVNEAFEQRQSDSTNSNFSQKDIQKIIDHYSKQNMMIAAASSIVPGPLGILSSVPELLLNFKNQMNMIYDLGCANGKENFINKDVLLDIPISAFGGNTNLSQIQDNTIDLEDSVESILIEKSISLGKSLVERTMKKSIVQFIPVAGPVLMGTWAKMTTSKISKSSIGFLDQQKVFEEHFKPEEDETTKRNLQIEKIKALANLIESNNEINENQIELIGTIIENSDLTDAEKEFYLEQSLRTGSKFVLNKNLIRTYEEEDDLLMQLVIMAKRTGNVDDLEKKCIYEIGKELEVDQQLIEAMF